MSQSIEFYPRECEGWDLNPRTSTGQGPQPCAQQPYAEKSITERDLKRFEAWLQSEKRISDSTARLYSWLGGKALREIGRATPSVEDVEGYRAEMRARGMASSSQSNTLMAIQHWLAFNGITAKFTKPKRKGKSPTYLTEGEARRLLEACESVKERAVISVLLYGGLRVSELCNLDRTDIDFEDKVIHIRNGKGGSDEYVAIDSEALATVRPLLEERDDTKPMLFLNRRGNRYTRKGIEGIVKACSERAGIEKKVSPHVLRHTLATNLLKNGCSLPFIQQQLRHRQIETTMVYLHSDKEMLKSAYERHRPKF